MATTSVQTAIAQFRRWRQSASGTLNEFLEETTIAGELGTESELLRELAAVAIAEEWQHGAIDATIDGTANLSSYDSPRFVEWYSNRWPELADEANVRRLIEAERAARCKAGVPCETQEYMQRFPSGPIPTEDANRAAQETQNFVQPLAPTQGMQGPTLPARAHEPNSTSKRFGEYEILEEIAQGGMGVVYKARQPRLNRIVALKRILSGQLASAADIERFLVEAQAAAQLDHPGIVPVFEVGQVDGDHYFSMGYVEGDSLDRHLRGKVLSPKESVELTLQVTQAVAYAHKQGVIHRDLKPANVLVSSEGRLRVTDFGLAKTIEAKSGLTVSGQVLGTPSYMPPEQALGRIHDVDARSDVYSIGATLYFMLTGRPPFQTANIVETLRQVSEVTAVSPRVLNSEVDRDLETIVMRCLEKEPLHRFASANDLAEELGRYLRDEPIQSRRVSRLAKAVRWCRRRPIAAGLVASLLALAVLGPLAVSLARQAASSRQLQLLTQQFEKGLDALPSSGEGVEQLRQIAADIAAVSGQEIQPEQSRIAATLTDRITSHLQQARLAEAEVQDLRSGIAWLTRLGTPAASRLSAALERRMSAWQTVAAFDATQGDSSIFLPSPRVRLDPAGRFSFAADRNDIPNPAQATADGLLTSAQWEHDGRLEATLAECEGDIRLSMYGGVDSSRYEFAALRNALPDGDGAAAEMRIEIRKDGIPVVHQDVHWLAGSGTMVALRASKEGNRLTFQVNELPPISFFDPFPLPGGTFGVSAAEGTRLLTLAAARRVYAESLSPLERADVLFATEEFEQALQAYFAQANSSVGTAFEAEAHYKAALCLAKLSRLDEAAEELQAVTALDIQPWEALARVQQWLGLMRQGKTSQADAMIDLLSSDYTFEQLAALVPSSLREEIVTSYLTGINARMGMVELDERQIEHVARASRVDRLLSPDGLGGVGRQIELSRVYRMAGRLEDAEKVLRPLAEQTGHHVALKHYSRVLRIAGKPEQAVQLLDRAISQDGYHASLLVDRAYAHAAAGSFDLAEADAARALEINAPPPALSYPHLQSQIRVLRGFLRRRLGDDPGALQEWRSGYQEARGLFDVTETAAQTSLVLLLIMGALSDELHAEDAARFVELTLASEVGPLAGITSMINKQTISESIRTMWDTPRGMEIAERFAYGSLPIQERIRSPLALAGVAFARQGAFQNEIGQDEEQVLWELFSELAESAGQRRQLGASAIMQLGLTWKGMTNVLGWSGVSQSLTPQQRGPLALLFGHRFLARGDRQQAIRFFNECLANSDNQPVVSRLAQQSLDLLNQQKGRIAIRGEAAGERGVVSLTQNGEMVAALDAVDAAAADLAPGGYDLALESNSAAHISRTNVQVRVGRAHEVSVDSLWKTGPPDALAGLLSRPADLRGIGRWQLVRTHMQGMCQALAINPARTTLAAAGNDCVIRLYDAETCEPVALLAGHADRVVSLDWHPDGRRLLSADVSGDVFIWETADQKRLGFCKCGSRDPRVAWHPQGDEFAVCGWNPTIEFRNAAGDLLGTVTHPGNYRSDLAWSPDGSSLATVRGDDPSLRVWRVSDRQEVRRVKLAAKPISCRWSPDGKLIGIGQLNGYEVVSVATWQAVSSSTKLAAHTESLLWEPDSRHFWTCGWSEVFQRWDVAESEEPVAHVKSYGNHRLRGSFDGTPVLYRNNPNGFLKLTLDGQVLGVGGQFPRRDARALTRFGDSHAVAFGDGRLLLRSDKGLKFQAIKGGAVSPTCLRWSPDGRNLATAMYDGTVQLWQVSDGEWQQSQLAKHATQVVSLAWNPSGDRLASISHGGALRIDSPKDNVKPIETTVRTDFNLRCIAWAPHGQDLAIGTAGKEVILVSSDATETNRLSLQGSNVSALAFTQDGNLYVGAGWRLELWDPGKQQLRAAWQMVEGIRSIVVLPGGRAVAGGERGLLMLCDPNAPGLPTTQQRLSSLINDMALLNENGDAVLVACEDGTLREIELSELATHRLLVVLDDGETVSFADSGEPLQPTAPIDSLDRTLRFVMEAADGSQQAVDYSVFYSEHGE